MRKNEYHKVFVWNQVLNILASDLVGVAKNQGQRAKVLIVCYYMAQVRQLLRHFNGLVAAKKISQEMRSRVSIKTLDSAQADKADIVFVDTANHSNLGHIGAKQQNTLTSTRAAVFISSSLTGEHSSIKSGA
ncbi:unnamed protein product [Fusarium graminearum]|nr:unnamed protein product [Fusarium graminearum]